MPIQQCQRCLLYARSLYVNCAVHPYGTEGDCLDFRENPELQHDDEELWVPQGYSWYGEELIPNNPPRLTSKQQLRLLDTHPFFTGVCPQCGHQFVDRPAVHWDCPVCGWIDDAIH